MNLTPEEQIKSVGVHPDVPFSEYLEWDAPSSHDLALIRKSPAHYAEAKLNPVEPTAAMRLGSACHAIVLEGGPSMTHHSVAVSPKFDRRTKIGKAGYAAFQAESGGRTVITEAEYETIRSMAQAVTASTAGSFVLAGAPNREHSCLWEGPGGVICRGRPDAYGPNLVVDLKTCADASPGEFGRTAARYGYLTQAAWYLDGLQSAGIVGPNAVFCFLAVEKTPPFGVAVYAMTEEHLEAGRKLYRPALATYVECRESGQWPSYEGSSTVQHLELPKWALAI